MLRRGFLEAQSKFLQALEILASPSGSQNPPVAFNLPWNNASAGSASQQLTTWKALLFIDNAIRGKQQSSEFSEEFVFPLGPSLVRKEKTNL
jgi:hypothetical protein